MTFRPFDIAVSFAGEDREFVEQVVQHLILSGTRVFYDRFEQHNLLGQDLGQYLDQIYQHSAHFVAVFISKAYAVKAWPKHEFSSALAGKIFGRDDYILPIMLDATSLAGLPPTIGFISADGVDPASVARLLSQKIAMAPIADEVAGDVSAGGIAIYLETYFRLSRDICGRDSYTLDYLLTTTKGLLIAAGKATTYNLNGNSGRRQPSTLCREVLTYDFETHAKQHFTIAFPEELRPQVSKGDDRWPSSCVREISAWTRLGFHDETLPFRPKDVMPTIHRPNEWSNLSKQLYITMSDDSDGPSVRHARFGISTLLTKPDDFQNFRDFALTLDGLRFVAAYTGEYFPGDFEDPSYLEVGLAIYGVRARVSAT